MQYRITGLKLDQIYTAMKVLNRFTYLTLVLIGCILLMVLVLTNPLVWALTGKSPACRFLDRYYDWMDNWKKRKGI